VRATAKRRKPHAPKPWWSKWKLEEVLACLTVASPILVAIIEGALSKSPIVSPDPDNWTKGSLR
jgi:hypothetical protein